MTNHDEPTAADVWPGVQVSELVTRLRRYNEWRRCSTGVQPVPSGIGRDLDSAADMLEKMSAAIVMALENNLHLADGDKCTLIDLVSLARDTTTPRN